MKAVDLLINSLLPEDLKDMNRPLDKKHLDSLLAEIARRDPDHAAKLIKKISDIGREASYRQGETITLQDMKPVFDKDGMLAEMDTELGEAAKHFSGKKLDDEKLKIHSRYAEALTKKTIEGALAGGNNLGNTVVSGARGSPAQLRGMVTTPTFYTDNHDRVIPLFVRNSFGEGLRPDEYLAGAFGVRKSVIASKISTAKGGAMGKQLSQNTAHIMITQDDCGTTNGLDMSPDDPDIRRRILVKDVAGIKAGTMIDRHVVQKLKQAGVKTAIVRSPLTCQSPEGICAECYGAMQNYKMPAIGEAVGLTSGNSLSEPLAQGALNTKHEAGAFSKGKKDFSGLNVIKQFLQTPETFADKAAVSEVDGKVADIQPAPQGGTYITVGDVQHYARPGFEPLVKIGDHVERGDIISDGLADPHDIVRLRGLGEGRKYYMERLGRLLEDSGVGHVNKLNLETVTRGTLDNVRITADEGYGHYLPDDVTSYSNLVNSGHSPPPDTEMMPVKKAQDFYLQAPVLHYTIGTQLTPKMLAHIGSAGFDHVAVSKTKPGFEPEMTRLQAAGYSGDDWLGKLNTSLLGRNLETDASRARDTDTGSNINYASRLMIGQDFGKNIKRTGKF